MKNILILLLICSSFNSCIKSKDRFKGIVSADQEPNIEWVLDGMNPPDYNFTVSIPVILSSGETINAQFFDNVATPGYHLLLYRNSHPKSKGKVIYVTGYIENSTYFIQEAHVVN